MRWLLVDTETTGISANDKVCEMAYVEIDDAFNVIRSGNSLINPGIPIAYGASAVNGIYDEMVADAPTLEEFLVAHGNPLAGDDVIFIAHNAPFDHRFLKDYTSEGCTLLDTLRCARVLYPEADNHKQSTLAAMFGIRIEREKAHSADGDLDVLLLVLRRMCEDACCDIEGLLKVQERPRPIAKISFGKHKGKALADLPKDYVQWLLTRADNVDKDLRRALELL